jgi:hypothetical protein
MQIEISASGAPSHVKTEIANQIDRVSKEHAVDAWSALVNLRDYAASLANKTPAGSDVKLSIRVDVTASYTTPAPEAKKEKK